MTDQSDTDTTNTDDNTDGSGDGQDGTSTGDLQAFLDDLGLTPEQAKGRLEASRKWEKRAKDNAAAKTELEELRKKSMTDQERAVAEAVEAAKAEARRDAASKLVSAEVRAAAAQRLTGDQAAALAESLDPAKFVTDDGDVDSDAVKAFVAAITPEPSTNDGAPPPPDLGQGRRGSGAGSTSDPLEQALSQL